MSVSIVYLFRNETNNECVYVNNVGKLEIESIVETICQKKKWEASDKVIIIAHDKRMGLYCYQNKDKCMGRYCYQMKTMCSKYEWIEIETKDEDEDDDYKYDDYKDDDHEDYDYEYDKYDEIDEDDRYDERDDYEGNGYEDEFYESCDMY